MPRSDIVYFSIMISSNLPEMTLEGQYCCALIEVKFCCFVVVALKCVMFSFSVSLKL